MPGSTGKKGELEVPSPTPSFDVRVNPPFVTLLIVALLAVVVSHSEKSTRLSNTILYLRLFFAFVSVVVSIVEFVGLPRARAALRRAVLYVFQDALVKLFSLRVAPSRTSLRSVDLLTFVPLTWI